MIQDIQPKRLHNEYVAKNVTENDRIIVFREREVLIARDAQDQLTFPYYGDLPEKIQDTSRYQYAFAVDDQSFFLDLGEGVINISGYHYEPIRGLRQMVSKEVCFAAMTAYHLYIWYRNNQFCGRCGKRLLPDQKERMLYCPSCGNLVYPKIAPAVIVALTDGDRILMSRYADREYKKYALLAGFTEIGETAEQTVCREVMEEVGLKVKNIRYYKSQPWGVDSNLLLGFFAELDGEDTIHMDEEELASAEWFHRAEMPAHDDGISLTREMMRAFEEGKY